MLNRIFAKKRNVQIFRNVQFWRQKSAKISLHKICRFEKSSYLCIRFRKLNNGREQCSEKVWNENFFKNFLRKIWKFKKSPYLCSPLWKIRGVQDGKVKHGQYVLWSIEAAKYVQKYSRFLNSMPLRNKPRF